MCTFRQSWRTDEYGNTSTWKSSKKTPWFLTLQCRVRGTRSPQMTGKFLKLYIFCLHQRIATTWNVQLIFKGAVSVENATLNWESDGKHILEKWVGLASLDACWTNIATCWKQKFLFCLTTLANLFPASTWRFRTEGWSLSLVRLEPGSPAWCPQCWVKWTPSRDKSR